MRAFRSLIIATVLVVGLAAPVSAQQTTTTMPPVRSIPVTPAPSTTAAPAATTTTTARTAPAGETAADAGDPLADTGIAADKLVPFGFLLIAVGAVLDAAARRYRRTAYSFF